MPPVEYIEFASTDGLSLFGSLQQPDGPARGFALFCHGITSDRSEWGIFDQMAEAFAALGLASLRFDFRGHGESALESEKIQLQGLVGDVRAAWSHLRSLPKFAQLPAFVVGSSFGGGIAYRTVDEMGSATGAFMLAPVFDYLADISKTAPRWKTQVEKEGVFSYSVLRLSGNIVEEARNFISQDAPAALPVTVFHGDKDDDVPLESSRSFAASHSRCELVIVEGAGHVIAAPGDFDMENPLSWALVERVIKMILERIAKRLAVLEGTP